MSYAVIALLALVTVVGVAGSPPSPFLSAISGVWFVSVAKTSAPAVSGPAVARVVDVANATLNLTRSEDGLSSSGNLEVPSGGGSYAWAIRSAPSGEENAYTLTIDDGSEDGGDLKVSATIRTMTSGSHIAAHTSSGGVFVCSGPNLWSLTVPGLKGATTVLSGYRLDKAEVPWWQKGTFLISAMGAMIVIRGFFSYQKEKRRLAVGAKVAAAKTVAGKKDK